jgi:hypothetical protein
VGLVLVLVRRLVLVLVRRLVLVLVRRLVLVWLLGSHQPGRFVSLQRV